MNHSQSPTMNQRIFQLGLSVETISLYLLICGLADSRISLSIQNMAARWNGSDQTLRDSIDELERREIISKFPVDHPDAAYRLTEEENWK